MFYKGDSSDIKFYILERTNDNYTLDFITVVFNKESNKEEMLEISLYTNEWDEVINKEERISLSQTYADEEKEFSFQYPSSWQHLSEEDFVQDGIGSNDIETARRILIEWFQRHPIKHDITLRFTEEAVDTGYDRRYLVYEVYIEQEEYGILRIDPGTGNMVMDSVSDSYGNWVSIQAAMEQWYLVYYWGCTDDSGYYSEPLGGNLYVMYDETGTELLEYDAVGDSFAICNWDICCSVEVE